MNRTRARATHGLAHIRSIGRRLRKLNEIGGSAGLCASMTNPMKGPSTRLRILGGTLATCALAGACQASPDDSKERTGRNSIVRENLGSGTQDPTKFLPRAVRTSAIRRHLEQFQRIADDNGGNRAAGTSGFDASALYVGELLTKAGYEVTYQRFEFPAFIEVRPASLRTLSPDRKRF
jgi:hypothetical protein